jgi:riboflavin-specific deaminase-like protein
VGTPASRWRVEFERSRAVALVDRPFITATFAVSEDLCLSANGGPTRLSCVESLVVTHELRSEHDALLIGVGTVLSDDPLLTTRLATGPSPLRVVLDTSLQTPPRARVLSSTSRAPVLFTTAQATPAREQQLRDAGAEVVRVAEVPEGVGLEPALRGLFARGVRSVMVEGGMAVLESFFAAGLVDFVLVTIAPRRLDGPQAVRLGPLARAAISDGGLSRERIGVDTILSGAFRKAARAGFDSLESGSFRPAVKAAS